MSFNYAKDLTIHGGAHSNVYGSQTINNISHSIPGENSGLCSEGTLAHPGPPENALQVLASHAAVNATSDAEARYPPPNCHPNTRVGALGSLGRWIEERQSLIRVYWVNGSVGVGKSAIAQTISENYRGRVIGSFFFSRNDFTRDKLDPFVATIAYQCCTSDVLKDIVGPSIMEAVRSNPNIFHTSSENQFLKLILEPFAKVKSGLRQKLPNLIIVDGLDECLDLPSQQRILGIVDLAITFRTPIPFIFLLCSRPEPQIRHGIQSARFASCLGHIDISHDSYEDIERYLNDKFTELRKKYRYVLRGEGKAWPSKEVVWDLTRRACGQFIFAVIVIEYIDNLDERPQDRLQTILTWQPGNAARESPYPALDMLYRQILLTSPHWDRVYPILRLVLTPHLQSIYDSEYISSVVWRSPSVITRLLGLKPGELEMLLSRVHSVIVIPDDSDSPIQIRHASFTEFLNDKVRSREYHILPFTEIEYCDLVATFSLRTLTSFAPFHPHRSPRQSFSAAYTTWRDRLQARDSLEKLSLDWPKYCMAVETPSANLVAELDMLDPYSFATLIISEHLVDGKWIECVTWAKMLKGPKPQRFITRMESFFQGFYVGLSKTDFTTMEEVLRVASCFAGGSLYWIKGYPLVVPATGEFQFPGDWIVIRLMQENRELYKRVYYVYYSLTLEDTNLFNKDIYDGTSLAVERGLVNEEQSAELKAMFVQKGEWQMQQEGFRMFDISFSDTKHDDERT
ncbi:hypothetical protein VNI00_000620 [Paramarasmius palmivorus]|uniref:Nephrocystin 3-like N-terminal domain-containing protein n=1 Tax=Paramarasmius palmivorus TaxID=297713 RepID=A0AAW0E992_9AGAR